MSDNNNSKSLLRLLFGKYVIVSLIGTLCCAGILTTVLNALEAGANVVDYTIGRAKDAATTVVDAVQYVGEEGIKGALDILKGDFKFRGLRKWYPLIQAAAQKYRIDGRFVAAVMYEEARGALAKGDPCPMGQYVVGKGHAIGLMQIMPDTGREICGMHSSLLQYPAHNIDCGARLLSQHLRNSRGDYTMAEAKYFGYDPRRGMATMDSVLHKSTGSYAGEVIQNYKKLQGMLPA